MKNFFIFSFFVTYLSTVAQSGLPKISYPKARVGSVVSFVSYKNDSKKPAKKENKPNKSSVSSIYHSLLKNNPIDCTVKRVKDTIRGGYAYTIYKPLAFMIKKFEGYEDGYYVEPNGRSNYGFGRFAPKSEKLTKKFFEDGKVDYQEATKGYAADINAKMQYAWKINPKMSNAQAAAFGSLFYNSKYNPKSELGKEISKDVTKWNIDKICRLVLKYVTYQKPIWGTKTVKGKKISYVKGYERKTSPVLKKRREFEVALIKHDFITVKKLGEQYARECYLQIAKAVVQGNYGTW